MKIKISLILFVSIFWLANPPVISAQEAAEKAATTFQKAAQGVQQQLADSLAELSNLRKQIATEKIPLNKRLNDLEEELVKVRLSYQNTARMFDNRALDLNNLKNEIATRKEEMTYVSNLLNEYNRNFESRLHISEIQRYREPLAASKLASENTSLSEGEVFQEQAKLVRVSLDRLHDALGGTKFNGTAVDPSGLVKNGTFVLVGPAALFQSNDGKDVGTAEQRLGSLEPAVIRFRDPENVSEASRLISTSRGVFPLDPTLGNAHKIEATKESLWEHIQKGGPIMVPIFMLAGAAFLLALYKWISLTFLWIPSQKRIDKFFQVLERRDKKAAEQAALEMGGPIGKMLTVGVEHLNEPPEIIEEALYENVLAMRLKVQNMLPFIAISASSAPLLGLLGTVTGIINTFKLITVFGSGDVKTLSGGISEALITTEYGLIVAIPSLLLHAFLSRKAHRVIDQMEKTSIAFINHVNKIIAHEQNKKEMLFFLNEKDGNQNFIGKRGKDSFDGEIELTKSK
ncbi:MAG: MotA/TolQ/ExbB proton channel family protein [Candidatus Omnitrophota bacterium]